MEKIRLKPTPQDILIKGAPADGHLDVFSYEPGEDENARKLGSLFVVGHVQHDTDDMAYSVSLMAALAKREYYARGGIDPKDAFAATLKKVNEVVEEFFEHKGVTVNVGVFALAGDRIYISKLGKFKVLLARGDRTIDVLNNIELFRKEKVEDRQFSSVISGKIAADDRILAFYPGRPINARERYLKADLLKLGPKEFVRKLRGIKEDKASFACAAVYVDLKTVRETATAPRSGAAVPQELAPKPNLASAPAKAAAPEAATAKESLQETAKLAAEAVMSSATKLSITEAQEMPRIIASEFSLGKKENPITAVFHRIRFINMTTKKKIAFSLLAAAVVIGGAVAVKALFLASPETRQLNALLESTRTQLELAKTKADGHDAIGARTILTASLAAVSGITGDGAQAKAAPVKNQLISLLDQIDSARDAVPVFVAQVPQELGAAQHIAALEEALYAYSYDSEAHGGYLAQFANGALKEKLPVKDMNATGLYDNATTASAIDPVGGHIASAKDGTIVYADFTPQPAAISIDFYQDNLYIMSAGGISKITDVATKGGSPKPWLKESASIPDGAILMAIDGDVFVMTSNGMLVTYYRGAKTSEIATSLAPVKDNLLMTTTESPNLYLVDKGMGRIYAIEKKTGVLVKTLKVGSANPLVGAAVGANDSLSILTSDNKIWKIQ